MRLLISSHNMQQIVLALFLLSACLVHAAEDQATNKTETEPEKVPAVPEEEETEAEEAEFRQGLSALAGYPSAYGGAGNQFASMAGGSGGSGYVNMLRNLYRPPSIGLTDKVKHWVKSFMNRRQYVKPYYNPSSLQYSADEFGAASKPVFLNGNSYKAISVPLRQLQKYYKPYYQEQQASGSNALLNYGLYSPSSAGLYSTGTGGSAGSSAFSAAASSPGTSQLFAGSSPGTSQLFAGNSFGGSSFGGNGYGGSSYGGSSYGGSNTGASQLFAGNSQGASQLFSGSEGLFSQGEGPTSALFSASGLYGTGGSQGSYQPSSAAGSSIYSIDSSSLYGSSDGSSAYYGASSSNGGSPSDLYASGANPVPSIYNPGAQGKKASESALYMPDQRNAGKETVASSSFSVDSGRNSPNGPQSSFSQFQGSNSGFQPVSFAS